MAGIILSVFLTIVVVAVALGIALWLRRLVVHRLKKTVLDNWLVQTFGALVTIPALILGVLLVSLTVTNSVNFILAAWNGVTAGLQQKDIANGIRALLWDF